MSEKREKEKRRLGLSTKTGYRVSDHGYSLTRADGAEILRGYPKKRRSKYMPHVGMKQENRMRHEAIPAKESK